ncbi:MAG: hypothetical protein ABIJ09_23280 [Pseudomonadota bacterium]
MEAVRDLFFFLAVLSFAVSLVSVPIGVTRRRRRRARLRAEALQLVEQHGLAEALAQSEKCLQQVQQQYEELKTPSPTRDQLAEGKKMYRQILELHGRHEALQHLARRAAKKGSHGGDKMRC